jgi:hypothetical protein
MCFLVGIQKLSLYTSNYGTQIHPVSSFNDPAYVLHCSNRFTFHGRNYGELTPSWQNHLLFPLLERTQTFSAEQFGPAQLPDTFHARSVDRRSCRIIFSLLNHNALQAVCLKPSMQTRHSRSRCRLHQLFTWAELEFSWRLWMIVWLVFWLYLGIFSRNPTLSRTVNGPFRDWWADAPRIMCQLRAVRILLQMPATSTASNSRYWHNHRQLKIISRKIDRRQNPQNRSSCSSLSFSCSNPKLIWT